MNTRTEPECINLFKFYLFIFFWKKNYFNFFSEENLNSMRDACNPSMSALSIQR